MRASLRLLAATALVSTALAAQAVAADRPTRALVIEPDVETRSRIVEVMVHVPVAGKPAAEVSEQALQAAIDAALALAAEQVPSVPAKDLVIQATEYHEHPVSNGKLPATLTAEVKFPAKPPAQSPQQIVIDQTSGEVVSGSLFTPVSAQAEAPLEVRVWTQSKEFADGDEMIIRIRGNKDFYGRLIYRDVGGNVVQILPNAYRADAMFKADTDYVVPGPGDKFRLRVSAPFGAESVVLMASTKPLGDISTKQAGNGMLVAEAGMDQVSSRTRALKLEPVEVAAATPLAAKAAAGADFIERTWTVTTKAK